MEFLILLSTVRASLRDLAKPDTDGREGLKSLEIIIAAYLSAKDEKTISLPLKR